MNDVKAWLQRVQYIDRRVEAKSEQVMRLRARLEGRRAVISDMPRGGAGGDWTDIVAKVEELEAEINAEIDRLIDTRREVVQAIDALPDERMRTLLELRYLNGWGWQRIANTMLYDRSALWRLHGVALRKIVDKSQHNATS